MTVIKSVHMVTALCSYLMVVMGEIQSILQLCLLQITIQSS